MGMGSANERSLCYVTPYVIARYHIQNDPRIHNQKSSLFYIIYTFFPW